MAWRSKRSGGRRPRDTLAGALWDARKYGPKIPENRIRKHTEWKAFATQCSPPTFIPDPAGSCSAPVVGSAHRLDIISPFDPAAANDILNVHYLDLHMVLAYASQAANGCTVQADTAAQSKHLRWLLVKWSAAELPPLLNPPELAYFPFGSNNRWLAESKCINWGDIVVHPSNSIFRVYDNEDDCTQTPGVQIGQQSGPGIQFNVKQAFRIPAIFRRDEGLSLIMSMKSWYTSTLLAYDYTVAGRVKLSYS